MKPIIAGGDGNTHWYECVCGEPINPYQITCQSCGKVVDWTDEQARVVKEGNSNENGN